MKVLNVECSPDEALAKAMGQIRKNIEHHREIIELSP